MTENITVWPYPALIAHRGGGRLAPENTLAGMRAAHNHGFTFVEYDVKLSSDGVPFLLHDDRLERTTNAHGLARKLNWDALQALDAGSWLDASFADERLISLETVAEYTQAENLMSNIELKPCPGREHETGTAVALAIRQCWARATVLPLLSSFSEDALSAAHLAAPEVPRALLVEEVPADWHQRLLRHGCVALNIQERHITQALVAAIQTKGYRVAAYTVNDPARARELFDWGIDALFTDELGRIGPTA